MEYPTQQGEFNPQVNITNQKNIIENSIKMDCPRCLQLPQYKITVVAYSIAYNTGDVLFLEHPVLV